MSIEVVGELEFRILNKNGTLERLFKKQIDSFVRQYADLLRITMANLAANVIDTSGVSNSTGVGWLLNCTGPAEQTLYGIVVGTGTNLAPISNYALQTKIAHGGGAGQLAYAAGVVNPVTIAGSTAYFTLTRSFTNNSGGDIVVNEIAIYGYTGSKYNCIARDLTGGITVQNTKTLAAQYTWQITA